jgi:hypothetical protein
MKMAVALLLVYYPCLLFSQEITQTAENAIEALTEKSQLENEDEELFEKFGHFKKHPLNINEANANDLHASGLFSVVQVECLLSYRRLFGKFVSIYELQAVPGWDINSIRRILPFISIIENAPVPVAGRRFAGGEKTILCRIARTFRVDDSNTNYVGNSQRMLMRYRYNYKNLLQYGITTEKDPGEKLFDFYSFHFFVRKAGWLKALALGDYIVNIGQGLILWQGMSFNKTGDITSIKNQSEVIKPYTSSGEFFFSRGTALTINFQKWQFTGFLSWRKLTANIEHDSITGKSYFTSVNTSGYHRTKDELDNKENLNAISYGLLIQSAWDRFGFGLNVSGNKYGEIQQKKKEPYNLFSFRDDSWMNFSVDYHYTGKNFHFFGETAMDKAKNIATVNGIMISLDPLVDFAILSRKINSGYQAPGANAFTVSSAVNNESGLYSAISIRPLKGMTINFYADIYKFPWLRYGIDFPSGGGDYSLQLNYQPNKQFEIYSKLKITSAIRDKVVWRTHLQYKITKTFAFRQRAELLWLSGGATESGFLSYADIIYKPLLSKWGVISRLSIFETDSYESRIYSYENDLLYAATVHPFYGSGLRAGINLEYSISKRLDTWFKIARTFAPGSLSDVTEVKMQFRFTF